MHASKIKQRVYGEGIIRNIVGIVESVWQILTKHL